MSREGTQDKRILAKQKRVLGRTLMKGYTGVKALADNAATNLTNGNYAEVSAAYSKAVTLKIQYAKIADIHVILTGGGESGDAYVKMQNELSRITELYQTAQSKAKRERADDSKLEAMFDEGPIVAGDPKKITEAQKYLTNALKSTKKYPGYKILEKMSDVELEKMKNEKLSELEIAANKAQIIWNNDGSVGNDFNKYADLTDKLLDKIEAELISREDFD